MPKVAPLGRASTRSIPPFQRAARLTNPTPARRRFTAGGSTVGHPRRLPPADPVSPASRLRSAIRKARQMQRVLQAGDEDVLIQSTLMQGLLSGDVMAASIRARLKLQRENQTMRRRLTMARIRTEGVKQKLLEVEVISRSRPEVSLLDTMNRIREIYGLRPMNQPLLPAPQSPAADIISEVL